MLENTSWVDCIDLTVWSVLQMSVGDKHYSREDVSWRLEKKNTHKKRRLEQRNLHASKGGSQQPVPRKGCEARTTTYMQMAALSQPVMNNRSIETGFHGGLSRLFRNRSLHRCSIQTAASTMATICVLFFQIAPSAR